MALSDMAIRKAKPREKPYKLADGGGLYLQVQPTGGKLWRQKYRINGSERKLSIGSYPEISLGEARKRRDAAREQLATGKYPSREKQRERLRAQTLAACTFSIVAAEYCDKRKMKMRKARHVPLSRQAVELFRYLQGITGPSGYAFPSVRSRSRPMSENTLNAGLRRLGYTSDEMTGHGFRAMASTLLNESGKWSPDAIERALAHGDSDKVRAAYHRGLHWKERVEMAQWWSDYLDELRNQDDHRRSA